MLRFRRKNFIPTTALYTPWSKRTIRRIFHIIGNLVLRRLTRTTIRGIENIPPQGPYIVAGNHRGIMEVALMLSVVTESIEIIGAGDIPLDRRYRYFARWYGYIPYRRGLLDRTALARARSILEHGGIVGIFPEGGIWKTGRKGVQRGVGWLSSTSGAPVVPVGFGGITEGIHKTITLSYPRFEARVGKPLYPESTNGDRRSRATTAEFADHVMERIDQLIPEWDRGIDSPLFLEEYRLELYYREGVKPNRTDRLITANRVDNRLYRPDLLSLLFHLPVLLNTLYFNLKRRGLRPLRYPGRWHCASDLTRAIGIVLGYTMRRNSAFFSYRLGSHRAGELERALWSWYRLVKEAHPKRAQFLFVPIKRTQRTAHDSIEESQQPDRFSRRL